MKDFYTKSVPERSCSGPVPERGTWPCSTFPSMTLAAPSTEIWVLSSMNLFTLFLLSFRENGMLFYLDDHALHVSLNLFLVMVTG